MKQIKLIAFILFITISGIAQAQQIKIAYINSQELLTAMPEAKAANAQLQAMASEMDSLYKSYIVEYQKIGYDLQNNTTMSEIAREAKMQDLSIMEQRLQNYEQDSQNKIDKKKSELYQPIIDKATQVVKDVAKEAGYTYVIDNSLGVLVMAPDGDDIMMLVKKKLNLQ